MSRTVTFASLLVVMLVAAVVPVGAEEEKKVEGSVEVLYRSVDVSGSERKYDEDFDGLDSGFAIGSLELNLNDTSTEWIDYARFSAVGIGTDPRQHASFRLGRKDAYQFEFRYLKQDYLYNLFELVPDEDGAAWDATRQSVDLKLRVELTEAIKLHFGFREVGRDGSSLFMKDIQRDVFRLPTPLDMEQQTFTVGADFRFGNVDLIVRQEVREYDNNFNNMASGLGGVEEVSFLSEYNWDQRDRGEADLTTVKLHAPLGSRVNLTAALWGTLLGEETIDSHVDVDQLGIGPSGDFGGTCAASGVTCGIDATCDAINAGDVCVPDTGTSRATVEGDYLLYDVDLSINAHRTVDLHLQVRDLTRDLDGVIDRDLDGDGTPEDPDGDGTAGSVTNFDYDITTITGLVAYRPSRSFSVRGGYRLIDRSLDRSGFGGLRDTDFKSGDDDGLLFGLMWKPTDWFKLNTDYEDGKITQPFNAVSPHETEHLRVRLGFQPTDTMQIDLSYLDHENQNTAADFRNPGSTWMATQEATTYSGAIWHRPSDDFDYLLRYARQEVDSDSRIRFDTAGFGGTELGNSIFANDNDQIYGRVNFSWAKPWRAWVSLWLTESDGDNIINGDVTGVVTNVPIMQDFTNWEAGLRHEWPSGLFGGLAFRAFDYDDVNNLLDYDGSIFEISGGMRF